MKWFHFYDFFNLNFVFRLTCLLQLSFLIRANNNAINNAIIYYFYFSLFFFTKVICQVRFDSARSNHYNKQKITRNRGVFVSVSVFITKKNSTEVVAVHCTMLLHLAQWKNWRTPAYV